jgi:alkylated DNA repair dioxygenase AlkB
MDELNNEDVVKLEDDQLDGGAEVTLDPEIEIVDDTPEEDKGKKIVKTKPVEVSDDELAQYSEDVQKRIKNLVWRENNERRAKSQAERERDEAVRIASLLLDEKRKAEAGKERSDQAHAKTSAEKLDIALASAQQKLEDALETFDAKAIAAANTEIAKLSVQKEKLDSWSAEKTAQKDEETTRQKEKDVVYSAQPNNSSATQRDQLAEAWAKRNPWFHTDPDMTQYALRVDQALQSSGVHPILDASDYYRKLDATIRAKFSDRFDDLKIIDGTEKKAAAKAAPSVVAGVTRTPTGTTKVRLSESQKRTAERLGIPLEAYARELANLRSE